MSGFTYAGGVLLLLAQHPRWIGHLRWVGQAGRMALTNYLLQIAVLDVMFSAYGLHAPEIRPNLVPLTTALLFGAEVVLSAAWLSRFRFGPAEWMWRTMTYGRSSRYGLERSGGGESPRTCRSFQRLRRASVSSPSRVRPAAPGAGMTSYIM